MRQSLEMEKLIGRLGHVDMVKSENWTAELAHRYLDYYNPVSGKMPGDYYVTLNLAS